MIKYIIDPLHEISEWIIDKISAMWVGESWCQGAMEEERDREKDTQESSVGG